MLLQTFFSKDSFKAMESAILASDPPKWQVDTHAGVRVTSTTFHLRSPDARPFSKCPRSRRGRCRLLEWIMSTAVMKGDQEMNRTNVVQTCRRGPWQPEELSHAFLLWISRHSHLITRILFLSHRPIMKLSVWRKRNVDFYAMALRNVKMMKRFLKSL